MDLNLNKYTAISAIFCLCSFMLVRFTDSAILSVFLKINHINFDFSIFKVTYLTGGQGNWTEGKVIFIYTLPYLMFALAGIFLPHILRRRNNIFLQMAITWLSFQMVLIVLAGLVSGIFEFQGIGVAMEWLLVNMPVKIFTSLFLLMLIYFSVRRFGWYFLRKVPHRSLHDDLDQRRRWLNHVVLYPFLISFAFIFPFAGIDTWLNFVSSFITGLIFILVIYKMIPLVYIPLN
ncbi:MAG TPA: hypothetical protein VK172_01545 [Lentimicrobium sp.]|nr:hypothetical protein [Bacteroidales bacterium]HLO89824.1 hypothetical protein [Lentimicrobium sp.]